MLKFVGCIIDVAPKNKVKGVLPRISCSLRAGRRNRQQGMTLEFSMSRRFTISELAKAAATPTTTLRYYERIGLLDPEDRSQGNYRLYGDESLRKVKFIRAAQAIGFTLDDVKSLLAAPDSSAASCQEVQALIDKRLEEVAQRLKDLRHVQQVLKSALEKCQEKERTDCCHVISTLRESSD